MYEVFEDDKRLYIVTEICKGGELYEDVMSKGKISERNAAVLLKQLLWCLNYLHKKNIVHRDLKPENILLEAKKDYDQMKIIDFGTATYIKPGQILNEKLGTPYYIAPEVLQKAYTNKCDIWACGVILYLVLSGVPPFNGITDYDIMTKIKIGKFTFLDPIWETISDECKSFIEKLLTYNYEKRPTAEEAL